MDVIADTNVWLRLADDQAAHHGDAKESLVTLLTGGASVYLVPQNVVEFWAVATRPPEANGLGWTIERTATEVSKLRSQFVLLPENDRIFERWSEVVKNERISGKRVHDARLAAQLSVHRVSHLLTFNDQDFQKFSWISILRPRDLVRSSSE
jgi:predicted nucleic acid-binding protein